MNARTTPGHVATVVIAVTVLAGACGAKADTTSDETKPVPHAPLALSDSEPGAGITGTASQAPASMNTSATGSPSRQSREAAHTHGAAGRSGRSSPNGPGGPADDAPVPSDSIALEDCRERYVIAPGVTHEVRERVPSQFTLRYNSNGDALLYITSIRCERYTAGGVTRSTTAAAFGASIESPDGVRCASRWPVLSAHPEPVGSCNNYLFFAAYDNPAVVNWARAGTPDAPVHLVEDLVFDERPFEAPSLGVPLHFESGTTPSGYTMDLVVRERPVELPLDAAFWFESEAGTVRVGFDTDAIAMGEASGQLTAEPGSEMAVMLGTETPDAQFPFPLLAGNRWERGTLTKTVVAADQK